MTTKIGIVGCGHVAAYARAFSDLPDCAVVALAALPSDERRTAVAQRYGISTVYDSVAALLTAERLDIVVVGSPPRWHAEHTKAALEAGCHVLTEKPPCLSYAEAAACYFRALYVDRHLHWGFCCRHMRGLPPPRPHLSSVHVKLHRTTGPGPAWARDIAASGGGCLADIGTHALDIGLYALGDPQPVAVSGRMYDAQGQRLTSGCEETFTGVVEVAGGRAIHIDVSWDAKKDEQTLTVYGPAPASPPHGGMVEDTTPLVSDPGLYLRCAQHFLHTCFAANRAQQLDITAHGLVVQRVLDNLYVSAASGHGISLS